LPLDCNQDVAEAFASSETTEPGDLVVLVGALATRPTVRKSIRAYDTVIVGVVATSPGLVFDNGETHLAGNNENMITPTKTIVGLMGRVPTKVSTENGPISVGDPLTSSSEPGVAMRANKAGQIVGYALENADTSGKILVHLQPGYYIPQSVLTVLNQHDALTEFAARQAEIAALKSQVDKLQALLEATVSGRAVSATK
jgi:hypothetical protein